MLTKQKLRALSPGQWARVRVPDYELWQKPCEWSGPLAGKEVDICVMPIYGPRYESLTCFQWRY
jgi:hypothetical protein